jgi:hypothetical protein
MQKSSSAMPFASIGIGAAGRGVLGVLATIMLTASVMVGLAPSASAINTTPCGSRTDLAKATYNGGISSRCWANAGSASATLVGLTRLCSGNNVVTWYVSRTVGGPVVSFTQSRDQCVNVPGQLHRLSIA